jgi:hypothetical protein
MSSRVGVAARVALVILLCTGAFYLPRFLFGTVSLLERAHDEPNMALRPGRQILGLRLEYEAPVRFSHRLFVTFRPGTVRSSTWQ